ncbi:hypothetical protein [Amycolatopsis sp. NPDC004378]
MDRPPRAYPLPQPENDSRFTIGLVLDVADVLTRHGYPPLSGGGDDHVQLQQALFRFLYTPST